jgi:hypothetical protein
MKKIIVFIACCVSTFAQGQIAINKTDISSTAAILDFPNPTNKGIVLPIVETLPTSPANGTIVMDKTDAQIKMFQDNRWFAVTKTGSLQNTAFNTSSDNNKQMIIGSNTTNASGVLVLEATNKAMILPNVANPAATIQSPAAGMIVYDTISKSVAFFNGLEWSFLN